MSEPCSSWNQSGCGKTVNGQITKGYVKLQSGANTGLQKYFLILFTIDKSQFDGGPMLKDYEINKPVLETDRLIIRTLNEADVPDLKEWLGRDEIYTYWGRKASKNEKNNQYCYWGDCSV